MWIVKATFFGLALFFFGSVICISSKLGPFTSNKATGFSVIKVATLYNPWWWGVTAGAFAFATAWVYLRRSF